MRAVPILALALAPLTAVSGAPAEHTECLQCPQAGDTVVFYVDDDAPPVGFITTVPWLHHINRIDRPVPTIAQAQTLIREMRSLCFKTGPDLDFHVRVEIREGTYFPDSTVGNNPLPQTLYFGPDDGGEPGFEIIYRAYTTDGGATYEPVLITGGVELNDWTTLKLPGVSPNRWWVQELPWATTDFKDDLVPRDLYVDNVRAVRAREPDVVDSPSTAGFADVETARYDFPNPLGLGPSPDKSLNSYTIEVNHLFPPASSSPQSYDENRGTEVVMRMRGAWHMQRQYVREVNRGTPMASQTEIRMHDMIGIPEMDFMYVDEADATRCQLLPQVYLENAQEFMDEPFEWFFNPPGTAAPTYNDNHLWIILPDDRVPYGPGYIGGEPLPEPETPNTKIVVPYARELFKLVNCSHVRFEGLNLAHTLQELPTPLPFNEIVKGQLVPVVEAMPGGNPRDTYERSGNGTPKYTKSQVDDDSTISARLDYPRLGWFERGRSLQFFKGFSQQGSDPLAEDEDVRLRHGAAIRIVNGEDCNVYRSRLAHLGGAGVIIENGSGHTVESCEIFDAGASGVIVSRLNRATQNWPTDGIQVVPDDFAITSNYIYEIGKTFLSSPAIHVEWTARWHPMQPVGADDGGFIGYNYMNELSADGIFLGNQTQDGTERPQTRGVNVSWNIIRNPAGLMDDMAGLVTMRDGDVSYVTHNVVFHDPPLATTMKRGIYTDGRSEFSGTSPRPGMSGWQFSQNAVWGFVIPFNMNTAATCPEYNIWSSNYTEFADPTLKCKTCATPLCSVAYSTLDTIDCGNGYTFIGDFMPFDPGLGRTIHDPNLPDPATRSSGAAAFIDVAGPAGSAPSFLYTTYVDLIHPTNPPALDRTPPDP